jgi:hypothetical protein
VAVADSGNHCIRISHVNSTTGKFVDDRMITFGDRQIADHMDGSSADALFSNPTGVAAFNNGILICDSGGRCLKYYPVNSVMWTVDR